jgi:valyl-tRNA synthetase
MLGDTAVAANPTDTRHSSLAGRKAILPLVNRELPIILDDKVEPDFGTGLVKITPAHDPDDFEIGQKHGLARLVVIGPEGKMNENAGPYADLDRYEARERILQDLKEQDLLEKVEEHLHAVGHCQRCNTPVEPVVSLQWFVKMEPLAKLGMEAVTSGKVRFIPQRWEKVYLDWLANIRDWCISRQLWWGHRIPVWYCRECGEENVENETPLNCHRCGSKELVQDEDVLDTWFSSALWPFSTLGWPEKTEDFAYFYPTSVLVTGYDIIYFWVARMIMMGMKFTGGEPFRKVWIHGLVRDAKGRKMSKSEGNVVDPLETVERFSADSLRYALASACALGQDFRLTEERLVGARNFCNKIWNAARFVLQASPPPANYKPEALNPKKARLADRWIMSLLQKAVARVTKALEEYRLDEACQAAHEFFWDNFCDWYIETSKLSLGGLPNEHGEAGKGDAPATNHNSPAPEANDTIWVLRHCLRTTMRLLHPIMPFISEEVWQRLNESGTGRFTEDEASNLKAQGPKLHAQSICIAPWPEVEEEWIDEEAEELMSSIMWIEQGIRDRCAALLLSPQEEAEVAINLSSAIPSLPKREILAQTLESRDIQELIKKLSGPWSIENIKVFRKQEDAGNWLSTTSRWAGSLPLGTTQSPSGIVLTVLPKGEVDLKSRLQPELERLRKELTLAEAELARSLVKISNPDFLSRARPEAVEKERKKEMEFRQKVESVQQRVKQIEKVMNNSTLATESRRD